MSTEEDQGSKELDSVTIDAIATVSGDKVQITIEGKELLAQGEWASVYRGKLLPERQVVAIKEIKETKQYKHREMEILMKLPPHRNIVQLQYFSADPIGDEENARLLTLVMDYLPTTLQEVIQEYATGMPSSLVQIYAGQLLSALAHLSDRNIVHRDVLPRNILIDQRDKRLKLADFGCAKLITPNSVNHPHVGSWQYRAIELLFGATHYSTKADIWSASVIILEMVSGQYPFPETSEDRVLDKIYTVLGPVSVDQVRDMGLDPLDFPHLLAGSLFNARRWSDIEAFPKTQSNELRSLLNEGLEYSPRRRADAATLLNHQFFKTDYTSPNQ